MGNIFSRGASVVQDDRQQLSAVNAMFSRDLLDGLQLNLHVELPSSSCYLSTLLRLCDNVLDPSRSRLPTLEFCDSEQLQEGGRVIPNLPTEVFLIIITMAIKRLIE